MTILLIALPLLVAAANMPVCTSNKPFTTLYNLGCWCDNKCLFVPGGEMRSRSIGGGRGTKTTIGYELHDGRGTNYCGQDKTHWWNSDVTRSMLGCETTAFCQPVGVRFNVTDPPVVLAAENSTRCCQDSCKTCDFFVHCSSCDEGQNTDLTASCAPAPPTQPTTTAATSPVTAGAALSASVSALTTVAVVLMSIV